MKFIGSLIDGYLFGKTLVYQLSSDITLKEKMNQVLKTNQGGEVFQLNSQKLLERFITLGTEGGTYYVSQQDLTLDNALNTVSLIKQDGSLVLETLTRLNDAGLVKQDPAIFTLALICTYGDSEVKRRAYLVIPDVCRTSTHLFTFCEHVNKLRGWSRGLRTGVARFYTSRTAEQIAYQLVKYRQRNGWTHGDVLRLTHPKPISNLYSSLFGYATGGTTAEQTNVGLIKAFDVAQNTKSVKELVSLILEFNLTWEMIPNEMLNNAEVLTALLNRMPYTALLRNLNRFANAGLTSSNTDIITKKIVERITNKALIQDAGIHPINLLNTLYTYSSGGGYRSKSTWTPNSSITAALSQAFELSYELLPTSDKKILVALDTSGSMNASINNMALTCSNAGAAMMLAFLKSYPNIDAITFNTDTQESGLNSRSSFKDALLVSKRGGGTDCAAPYRYALKSKVSYDGIIVLTDNETALRDSNTAHAEFFKYKSLNPNCKTVVIAMAANRFSLFPDSEENALNVSGFDATIPNLINSFI